MIEPTINDPCNFLTDHLLFEKIKRGAEGFSQDWMIAMTQDEKAVTNITTTSDINKGKNDFSDILAKPQTLVMIANRYKLATKWVDGTHCIVFRTRPLIYWASGLHIWKHGTMSQMMEHRAIASGMEVCVVCHTDTVMIHGISQDGPPPPTYRFFMLPWQDVTFEQEAIIKTIMRSFVDELNKHLKVEELL